MQTLYEDKNLLIIDKPFGLVVHSDGRASAKATDGQAKPPEPTVVDWLLLKYPEIKEVGEPWTTPEGKIIYRPGIVHRLDRETSGVLAVAKTQESFVYLKNLFQTREISKIYNAFVYGEVKQDEGVIDRPISRSKKDFRMWSAQRGGRGVAREAVTNFNVLKKGGDASYLEVRPLTGRTHQIRVHFKAINHPIVCDKLYAPKRDPILGFERLALHARSIEFRAMDGTTIKTESPLPPDFQKALDLMV